LQSCDKISEHKSAEAQKEAENSDDDKESGATIPKPPNLVERANNECYSALGG